MQHIGAKQEATSRLAGHAIIGITESRYLRVQDEARKDALNCFDNASLFTETGGDKALGERLDMINCSRIRESFEPMKVSDVIEVLNHIHCVDYILDHVMEPLSQKLIRKLHQILMTGTVDAYREQVRPGEYRTITSRPRDRQLLHPDKIHSNLAELITTYEKQPEIERNHILDFHVRFEEIFPFEDGNGRVGRLLMFKECLRHDVMPFIIDDKRRSRYLRGIKEWHEDHYELLDVVMEAQDRFELQKLYATARLYLPAGYTED